MSAEPLRLDRRHRRREETIEQILDVAIELMGEQGAAGLSLGEVARRMGIRTPSLYGYFDSKNALYDALFSTGLARAGGAPSIRCPTRPTTSAPAVPNTPSLSPRHSPAGRSSTRRIRSSCIWRPIPGYEPSPDAYAPAVEALERGREIFCKLRDSGALAPRYRCR